jgi:hypothetical protein
MADGKSEKSRRVALQVIALSAVAMVLIEGYAVNGQIATLINMLMVAIVVGLPTWLLIRRSRMEMSDDEQGTTCRVKPVWKSPVCSVLDAALSWTTCSCSTRLDAHVRGDRVVLRGVRRRELRDPPLRRSPALLLPGRQSVDADRRAAGLPPFLHVLPTPLRRPSPLPGLIIHSQSSRPLLYSLLICVFDGR